MGASRIQLGLSIAYYLHLKFDDVIVLLLLEGQRIVMDFGLSMGEGVSGLSLEPGSWRSPFASTLMLQSAVSPEITSPVLIRIVQITLSLYFASHVPANFFCASASWAARGRLARRGKGNEFEHGFGASKSMAVYRESNRRGWLPGRNRGCESHV